MKKKDQILEIAIRLFNEKGYANVSLREIAKEAGTTIGNLTYHFPQKEDLVSRLLDTLQVEFIMDVPQDKHGTELLSHLLDSFLLAEQYGLEYPFYYKNVYEFTIGSETLMERNRRFVKNLYDYYLEIFRQLKAEQIFREKTGERDIAHLAYVIVLSESTWLQANSPYSNVLLPNLRQSETLSRLVRPHIRKAYGDEFEKLMKKKGISMED